MFEREAVPWNNSEVAILIRKYKGGFCLSQLSRVHRRTENSIYEKLCQLKIVDDRLEEDSKDEYGFTLKDYEEMEEIRAKMHVIAEVEYENAKYIEQIEDRIRHPDPVYRHESDWSDCYDDFDADDWEFINDK